MRLSESLRKLGEKHGNLYKPKGEAGIPQAGAQPGLSNLATAHVKETSGDADGAGV